MKTEEFCTLLLSAAAFLQKPLQDVSAQSLKDLYAAAKAYLRRKFGDGSDAAKVLELATEKPESAMRKALLVEETTSADLENDPDLRRFIAQLAAALPATSTATPQTVRVVGRNNHVQVAARDIIHTARHVQRCVITPDERHLDAAQKRQLGALVAELADRLAGDDGQPRFGAVHQMLQRKFNVTAFALLPRERFDDALAFLKQQRAIHRSSLQRRNPAAYQQDFFRRIHARRAALGWDKSQLYAFATEKLAPSKPVTSLRQLGSLQLKSLAAALPRAASAEP